MPSSYDDVQGSRENFDRTAVQKQYFAVHNHVGGTTEIEIRSLDRGARGQRMRNMRAGEKSRKIPEKPEAADWRPTHVFDLAVRGICLRGHHHLAASEFAVGERQKKTRAPVPVFGVRELMSERMVFEPREHRKHAPDVACGSPAFEPSIGNFSGVGGKTKVQDVDEINVPGRVAQPNHVADTPAVSPEGLDRVFDAARSKVAQERIARAERKQSQCRPAFGLGLRKKSIDDLKRGAIAPHGKEIPVTLRVGCARKTRGLTCSARLSDFQVDTGLANTAQRLGRELAATSAPSRRVDDRKEARVHWGQTSPVTLEGEVTAARPLLGSAVGESRQPGRCA